MNFYDPNEITKLEEKLTEVLAKEYDSACAYVAVDKVEFSYIACEPGDKPTVTITLRYGVYGDEKEWQKNTEIFYENDSLDFIAGQFFQVLITTDK